MIIARSPLRITLGGGGTDLPSYYEDHGGFLVAAAIDKYVYVTVMRPFTPGIFLKYSQLEHVEAIDKVQHRIIREAGFSPLGIPRQRGFIYTIAVIDRGGEDGRLVIDARSGRILRFVPASTLPYLSSGTEQYVARLVLPFRRAAPEPGSELGD